DGNLSSGDGCNAQCLRELGQPCTVSAQCASGFCDPAGNVCSCDQNGDCPPGQLCNTSATPNVCVAPGCGNGVLEPATEGDDDGDCPRGQVCNVFAAPNQCVPAGCGNGVVEAGEGCDDGNQDPGDGCSAQCLRELGQPCTLSAQCQSGFCDPAGNLCACDDN